METRSLITPEGTRITYKDELPQSPEPLPAFLLLHGLAGHLAEWDDLTGRLLTDGHRVIRYDARRHGDTGRAAAMRDALTLLTSLNAGPTILLGQSLGGLTALLTAAAHPSYVRALILLEAGPADGDPAVPGRIGAWLDSWPKPFPSYGNAVAFFGHYAWADGLDWHADGTGHARVDRDAMVAAVTEPSARNYWAEWERVRCPSLVLRGDLGVMRGEEAEEMRARRPDATRIGVIEGAGHDVHLDRPEELYGAVSGFVRDQLTGIGTPSAPM